MAERTAVVVGAGIGGLTAGVALARQDWQVQVLEQAPEIRPVGAGLAVAPNALRALDTVGLGGAVRGRALQGMGGIRSAAGRWLLRTDMDRIRARFGDPLVVLRRADLLDILIAALPDRTLITGAQVTTVDPGDSGRPGSVTFRRGERTEVREADLVVAADGIDSAIRPALFPGHPAPVYSGATCWRILTHLDSPVTQAVEIWGRGRCAGVMPLDDGWVFVYLVAPAPEGQRAPEGERRRLIEEFGDWGPPVARVLDSAAEGEVIRGDLRWLATPLPHYHRGRAALLGDAAHAMLPYLGQGACQAIEDAVELAHALGRGNGQREADSVLEALAAYSFSRAPRANAISAASASAERVTRASSRSGAALRNAGLSLVGRMAPGLFLRQLERTLAWQPPA
jgi:2-polyprenyl-6-methoxyphenol hydroxylase-like FAD-dependent oxidoreductase